MARRPHVLFYYVLDGAGGQGFVFAYPGGEEGFARVGMGGEAAFCQQGEALYQVPEAY